MFYSNIRSRKSRVGGTVGVIAAAVVLLAGCSTSSTPGSSGSASTKSGGGTSSHNYKITFVPKSLGNPYFQASDKGGDTAVTGFGGTYAEVAPATSSPTGQVSFVQTLTQQKVGGIVLSADDPQAACTALKAAMSAGIKVVTFDSDTACRDVFVNQATNEGIAKSLVDIMGKQLGGKGNVAIESGGPNATNLNAWVKLIKSDLASSYPNIKVLTTVYGNDDDATSFNVASALVRQYPSLNGIIAPDSVSVAAAGRYLSTSKDKGKIALTGLGLPSQLRSYVKDGTIQKFALWDPTNLGYLSAYAAKALIDGTITGKQGDKFNAGKLGSYTVGAGGVVILGPPTVFDSSNIDNYHF